MVTLHKAENIPRICNKKSNDNGCGILSAIFSMQHIFIRTHVQKLQWVRSAGDKENMVKWHTTNLLLEYLDTTQLLRPLKGVGARQQNVSGKISAHHSHIWDKCSQLRFCSLTFSSRSTCCWLPPLMTLSVSKCQVCSTNRWNYENFNALTYAVLNIFKSCIKHSNSTAGSTKESDTDFQTVGPATEKDRVPTALQRNWGILTFRQLAEWKCWQRENLYTGNSSRQVPLFHSHVFLAHANLCYAPFTCSCKDEHNRLLIRSRGGFYYNH